MYKCKKCDKEFVSELEYKRHIKTCVVFEGIATIDMDGYRDNLVNGISLDQLWNMGNGKHVKIIFSDC